MYTPGERNTQDRRRRAISEPYGEQRDAAREDRLEPQKEHAKEELSPELVMTSTLRFIDERSILFSEKTLCSISPDSDKPGNGGAEQCEKLRGLLAISRGTSLEKQTGDLDADSSLRNC
jgi:hypothetical protein